MNGVVKIDDIREAINVYRTNTVKEPEWILLSRALYESLPFKCNAVFYGDGVVSVNYKEFLAKLSRMEKLLDQVREKEKGE